eukprot:UN23757
MHAPCSALFMHFYCSFSCKSFFRFSTILTCTFLDDSNTCVSTCPTMRINTVDAFLIWLISQ